MSNIPCEIIRDLMVLYDDSVCSEETKREIEEHLAECEVCRAYYREECRAAEFELKSETDEGEQTLGKIKERILRRQWIIAVSVVLVCIGIYLFADKFVFWAPSDEVKVKELYQLENGAIAVRLQSEKFAFQPESTIDNEGNMTCKVGTTITANLNKMTRAYLGIEKEVIVINQGQAADGLAEHTDVELKSVVYKGRMFDEELVIWEQGQEIDPAPEELEKKFAKAEAEWMDETGWSWLVLHDMDEEVQ